MNRQYLEYSPEVGAPTANSHHGQQHRLQKQPECKAANLSEDHDAENLFSSGGPCGGSGSSWCTGVVMGVWKYTGAAALTGPLRQCPDRLCYLGPTTPATELDGD